MYFDFDELELFDEGEERSSRAEAAASSAEDKPETAPLTSSLARDLPETSGAAGAALQAPTARTHSASTAPNAPSQHSDATETSFSAEGDTAEARIEAQSQAVVARGAAAEAKIEPPTHLLVRVDFCHVGQTWCHNFRVEYGSTVGALKRQMTSANPAEASWFELRRLGRPVADSQVILVEATFDFLFRGPPIPVIVRHAVDSNYSVTVEVPASATVHDLRCAMAAALGEELASVKIMSRIADWGSTCYRSVPDLEPIGGQREFASTCEAIRSSCVVR